MDVREGFFFSSGASHRLQPWLQPLRFHTSSRANLNLESTRPSDVEDDHLAVSTDCTQRSPMKMETISAESRPAGGSEGVSRHPLFMSPITQNDGISMNNAATASCSGLECDVHERHEKKKGRGCSERLKRVLDLRKTKKTKMKIKNAATTAATVNSRAPCH